MTRLYVTTVAQEVENKHCLKTLKPLLSKGCGRGEIGKHKGLKRRTLNHRVTSHPPNSFKYNNYLVDILSDVPLLVIGTEVTL